MTKLVELEVKEDVATLTLTRAHKMNALNLDLFIQLKEKLMELKKEPPSLLVIRGGKVGEKRVFSAGIDLKEVFTLFTKGEEERIEEVTLLMQSTYNLIEDIPCPTLCVVEGFAFGAGMELMLACDMVLAESSAEFGMLETSIGLIPDLGGTSRLVRKIGSSRAKELIFLAKKYDSETMERYGLINWITEDIEVSLNEIVDILCKNSKKALISAKKLIADVEGRPREEALELERHAQYGLIREGIPAERIKKMFL